MRRLRPERVPPHNLEAEESILGAMMLSGEAIADVIELKPSDFYTSAHREIFETIRVLYGRGDPVDAITTVEELKRRGTLEQVGGPLFIHELVREVPTAANAFRYADIVRETAQARRVLDAAEDALGRIYSGE